MKKFVFSVASRATGQLQIKPSGSGDENAAVLYPMPGIPLADWSKGSREHKWWRSNANESRDPKKQYPYCLSRALIGYSRYRPYVLLLLYDR